MKKTLILALAAVLAIATSACGFCRPNLKGSGKLVTRTVRVSDFGEVQASRGVKVILTEGAANLLTIEADDNLIDYVVTQVKGRKLEIGIDPKIGRTSNIHVTVTVPTDGRLASLEADSAAEIRTRDLVLTGYEVDVDASSAAKIDVAVDGSEVSAEASSAAEIIVTATCTNFSADASSASGILARLTTDACKAEASSAAKITLSGTAATCEAEIDAASTLEAQELVASVWDIEASSGSSARIHCTGVLKARASSGASIVYRGDCTAHTNAMSGGSIRKR